MDDVKNVEDLVVPAEENDGKMLPRETRSEQDTNQCVLSHTIYGCLMTLYLS